MKHIHVVLMTVLLSVSASAAEGELEARKNILGVSLMLNQWGTVGLTAERVVSPRLVVGLGLRGGVQRTAGRIENADGYSTGSELKNSAYMLGVGPQARLFLTGTAPEGLWLSPRLEATRWWTDWYTQGQVGWVSDSEDRRWSLGGVAMLGYSAIVGRGLSVQVGVGAEARHERGQSVSLYTPQEGSDLIPSEVRTDNRAWHLRERFEASLGWAF